MEGKKTSQCSSILCPNHCFWKNSLSMTQKNLGLSSEQLGCTSTQIESTATIVDWHFLTTINNAWEMQTNTIARKNKLDPELKISTYLFYSVHFSGNAGNWEARPSLHATNSNSPVKLTTATMHWRATNTQDCQELCNIGKHHRIWKDLLPTHI